MILPPSELCEKDSLLNLIRQGDAREYFNPRRGANQRFLVQRRIDYSLDLLMKHLIKAEGASVADFACGSGTLGLLLAEKGCSVDFIDNEPKFFDYIKMKNEAVDVNFIQADASQYVGSKKYSAIFFGEALEHMENPEETLVILRENLQSGGLLCLTTPNGDFVEGKEPSWTKVRGQTERNKKLANNIGNHVCEFTYQELPELLKNAGFGMLEHQLINSQQISQKKILRRILPKNILWMLDSMWSRQQAKNEKYYGRTQIAVAQRFH